MVNTTLKERLQQAAGPLSKSEIARLTNCHQETVRRYMAGKSPSVAFLIRFANVTNTDLGWILTGEKKPDTNQILWQIERLATRVEVLEGTLRGQSEAHVTPPAARPVAMIFPAPTGTTPQR